MHGFLTESRPSSSRSATSRKCAPRPMKAAAMCCSNLKLVSISSPALADVRAKVDQSQARSAEGCRRAGVVTEVNLSLYPVLVVALAGEMQERSLFRIARNAKNVIEQVPGVLLGPSFADRARKRSRSSSSRCCCAPMVLRSTS